MSVGRNQKSKDAYLDASRKERHEMVMYAPCDGGREGGLLRLYQMGSFRDLARVRKASIGQKLTKAERLKRWSEFYNILSKMADRQERLAKIP